MRFNPFVPHGPEPFTPTPRSGGLVPSVVEYFKKKIDELFRRSVFTVNHISPIDGNVDIDIPTGVIRYDVEQDLTDDQKQQARENIGANGRKGLSVYRRGNILVFTDGQIPDVEALKREAFSRLPEDSATLRDVEESLRMYDFVSVTRPVFADALDSVDCRTINEMIRRYRSHDTLNKDN